LGAAIEQYAQTELARHWCVRGVGVIRERQSPDWRVESRSMSLRGGALCRRSNPFFFSLLGGRGRSRVDPALSAFTKEINMTERVSAARRRITWIIVWAYFIIFGGAALAILVRSRELADVLVALIIIGGYAYFGFWLKRKFSHPEDSSDTDGQEESVNSRP
jgi:hypothetical protein